MSRPQPSQRVGERTKKIERGTNKGMHAEQKTTGVGSICYASVDGRSKHASQKKSWRGNGTPRLKARLKARLVWLNFEMKRRQLTFPLASSLSISTRIAAYYDSMNPW